MRKRWNARVAAPLACAAMMIACGGSDGANDDRPAQQARTNQAEDAPAQAVVALTGCVEAAPGTNQYVLRNVQFQQDAGGDPQSKTTTSGAHGITEGAWVRLEGGDNGNDLTRFAGQRVTMVGTIADDGRNTIGTSGTSGVQTPSGDRSQAAGPGDHSDKVKDEAGRIARESMADGTAAEVEVTAMEASGEPCKAAAGEERR